VSDRDRQLQHQSIRMAEMRRGGKQRVFTTAQRIGAGQQPAVVERERREPGNRPQARALRALPDVLCLDVVEIRIAVGAQVRAAGRVEVVDPGGAFRARAAVSPLLGRDHARIAVEMREPREVQAAQGLAIQAVLAAADQLAETDAADVEMQVERVVAEFVAGRQRFFHVAVEACERQLGRVEIQAVAREFVPAQRQALVVVEHDEAVAGRQQQRQIPAAPAAEARRSGPRQQHLLQCRLAIRNGLAEPFDETLALGRPDVGDLATQGAGELAQQVTVPVDVDGKHRVVEHDVVAAGTVAAFVLADRGEQALELGRAVAGAHEDRTQRSPGRCRTGCQPLGETGIGDKQIALYQALQHAGNRLALLIQARDRALDARHMFIQRTELAALVERLQHLKGHDVGVARAFDLEYALVVGQRRDERVLGREQRGIRVGTRGRDRRRRGVKGVLVLQVVAHVALA
jgi:hypothetical protein